ncbi:hypothetical protein TNCV_111941 [Trichonephila clavipes]|nr:hypothetical protein TNCV_111941 [Trichonephila clavipes]
MTVPTQRIKIRSAKRNKKRKEKLSERDRQVLRRIIMSKKRTTATKVTTQFNQHLDSPVSMIIVRMHHKQYINSGEAISKTLAINGKAKRRLQ